jgi:hypothetical protein
MNNRQVRVFLSFEFDKDNNLHRSFYAQAQEHSKHQIIDTSLKEPYHPDELWLKKARKHITQSDIVIVMLGDDTHNALGVEKEVTVANQLKKPIFQIRPKGRTSGKVKGAGEVIKWDWKQIDAMITKLL